MPKYGKNKKKAWRKVLPGLDEDIQRNKVLSSEVGFVIDSTVSIPIVKGDKDVAKKIRAEAHLSSTSSEPIQKKGLKRLREPRFKCTREQDKKFKEATSKIWKNVAPSQRPAVKKIPKYDEILPGQSYNPDAKDYEHLLQEVIRVENKELPKVDTRTVPKVHTDVYKKTLTADRKKKKQRTDMENIPKILKEISREEKRRQKLADLRAQRKSNVVALKQSTTPRFQLPTELSSSLRTLKVEGDTMYDMMQAFQKRGILPVKTGVKQRSKLRIKKYSKLKEAS